VAYSKKNFKEPLWHSNSVWVRVPKQVSLQFTSKHWQRWSRCDVFRETVPDLGPAEVNERSPTVTSHDGRMSGRLEDKVMWVSNEGNELSQGHSKCRSSVQDWWHQLSQNFASTSEKTTCLQLQPSAPLNIGVYRIEAMLLI